MTKRRGFPQIGEVVVCKITGVNPNSAFASLEEYNVEGIIHISEITSGWVRDIREHLKQNQIYIAKVMRISENHIDLSIRRLDSNQKKEKMKEYKLDQRAEKMLELVAKEMGKSLDEAYEEAGFKIQETVGSLYEGFRKALVKPEALAERGVPEQWIKKIREIAEKNIEQKEFVFRADLNLKTHKPGGISRIRSVLHEAGEMGLETKYISAPVYLIKYKTKNAKKGLKEFTEKLDKLAESAKDLDASFKLLKS